MNLHQFYMGVWTRARTQRWRVGQALFNNLLDVRPDLAEQIRGTDKDPFYAESSMEPRYNAAIKFVEENWLDNT